MQMMQHNFIFKKSTIYHAKNTHDKRTTCRVQDAVYSSYGPWDTFPNRAMRQPNVSTRLSIRTKPSKIKLEGWGDNALRGTPANLQ